MRSRMMNPIEEFGDENTFWLAVMGVRGSSRELTLDDAFIAEVEMDGPGVEVLSTRISDTDALEVLARLQGRKDLAARIGLEALHGAMSQIGAEITFLGMSMAEDALVEGDPMTLLGATAEIDDAAALMYEEIAQATAAMPRF